MADDDALVLAGYDELMGRVARKAARRGGRGVPMMRAMPARARNEQKLQKMAEDLPAASGRVMRQFLGFPFFVFTNATGTIIQQTTRPQRTIQLDRVIATQIPSAATLLQQFVVIKFKIGAEDMLAGNDGIPLSMFVSNATSARFHGYTAKSGIDCVLQLQIVGAALGAGETITVTVGGYGDTVAA